MGSIPKFEAVQKVDPPAWALWERRIIDICNQAGVAFVERYTRPDGTLVWRDNWPGMDGSDDAYESFWTFPLFYLLGGSEKIHYLARKEWDAVTWQFTEYGQVYREFDAYYDWMHHGESYSYLYYLGLCDPHVFKDRQRAFRFAGFYVGEDNEAQNYDSELKLIRSPINGSRGPRHEMSPEDWSTHRDVLANYPVPFEDIPGIDTPKADWNDDEIFERILDLLNRRMAKGDVPLNLTATSMIVHAYLYNGDQKYKNWVVDYIDAWYKRTKENNGIMPDNVGLSGEIGECMDGKWWGGYYGWRWPHGAMNLLESTIIAGLNAMLLTGDEGFLDLARSQQDLLWSLGREENGDWVVPFKHLDSGWSGYGTMSPNFPLQLWNASQSDADLDRILRLGNPGRLDKDLSGRDSNGAWFRYVNGDLSEFPEKALESDYQEICRRLDMIDNDDTDPTTWDVHHWQARNPVVSKALAQLTTGGPSAIYHGGLLNCRVRHFDPDQRRSGLPADVAALVESVFEGGFQLQLINLNSTESRNVISLAGAFGEHQFLEVEVVGTGVNTPVDCKWIQVHLMPRSGITLRLKTRRYVNQPTYDFPWLVDNRPMEPIKLRTPEIDPGSVPVGG